MYVSPINNSIPTSNYKRSRKLSAQRPSFKKTQTLIGSGNLLKKVNRYLNMTVIALLPVVCFQFQNQVNEITKDYVQYEPLIKDFDTQESALNYSIERITERLNADEPKEYSVFINNKNHNIISEVLGNDSSVLHFTPVKQLYNWATTYDYSYTSLHGHPVYSNGATSSFSFQDFKSFVSRDNCSTTYVVNKDSKYCRLEKTSDYKKVTDEELEKLKEEYDYHSHYSWDRTKKIYNTNGELVFKLVDYPGMHVFWDSIAKRYGMKYVTTYGTYGVFNNIYANGYHEGFDNQVEIIKD